MIKQDRCLICDGKETSLFLTCIDHFVSKEKFEIAQCKNCEFKFTGEIPAPDQIGAYYKSEEYISHSDTQKGIVNKLYHTVRNVMLKRKARLIEKLTDGKKLIDIGCGTGYFPYYMKKRGFDASGMELDKEARKFANENFGLKVNSPDEVLETKKVNEYDIITLWHVMEHLHDPAKYLKWMYTSLKHDGVLLIALPNCNSHDAKKYREFWAAYDVPRHLWHFEPKTFKKYILTFGFELKQIKRLPFDAYYNSMMSAKYAGKTGFLIFGVISGFISNLKSLFDVKKSSSVIYILTKKH